MALYSKDDTFLLVVAWGRGGGKIHTENYCNWNNLKKRGLFEIE